MTRKKGVTQGGFDFLITFERIKKGDTTWLGKDFVTKGYINLMISIDSREHGVEPLVG